MKTGLWGQTKWGWSIALAAIVLGQAACGLGGSATSAPPTTAPTADAAPPITAPAEPTQAETASPQHPSQPSSGYAVVFVSQDDVLNVRTGPGVNNGVAYTLPHDTGRDPASLVTITGEGQTVDGDLWVPISTSAASGGDGWANRDYLTEAVPSEAFCADPRANAIITSLTLALESGDGASIAALVHPVRGLFIREPFGAAEVYLTQPEVAGILTDTTPRDWALPGSELGPRMGSLADLIAPMLKRDLLDANVETGCNEILHGNTPALIIPQPEYGGFNYFSLYRPPVDQQDNILDWGTWAIGIEYQDGLPYLVTLVHYQWEP